MSNILALSDATWKSAVTNSNEPMLVLFHAPWAGPSILALDVFEIANKKVSKDVNIRFGTFDIDDNPITPQEFGLKAIPSFMLFDGKALKSVKVGLISDESIVGMIQ